MKRHKIKTFTPISAVAAVFGLAASSLNAQTTPVFEYGFPASWNGTDTTITDVSGAGNNGVPIGTLSLDSVAPPGAPGGTQSINTTAGGVLTSATALLNNATVASAGGFTYNLSFMWNGTDSSSFGHTEKLIDYAGTESLQLVTTSGQASLQAAFANNAGAETIVTSTTILPNTWYNVKFTFNTIGNSLDVNGDIGGTAALYVNGSLASWGAALKGNYGDGLNRPIGVGQLGANFGYLVGFKGDIFDPSVQLGVVPEPSALALGALGGLGLMFFRRRKS